MTRPTSRRKAQPVPTPLTRTSGPFNATNNALDGYETNCTDRWRYIKTPLQIRRRYLKETLTPQRLESKATYIKPSTLPWKGTKNINLRKKETIGRDGIRIHTWGGPKLKTEKKIMKIKTNIYFIFNKILHTK